MDPLDVEFVEIYTRNGDASRTLDQRWPRGMPCGSTGLPRSTDRGEIVYWVSVWTRR